MPRADLTRSVWDLEADEYPAAGDVEARASFLLRYAILAPSSHNSQPWRFRVTGNEIAVGAETSRWLEAADPDQRELYLSVGCALENLCVAAEHVGFDPQVAYHDPSDAESVATVRLREDADRSNPRPSDLFDAITTRYTSHEPFADRPVGAEMLEDVQALVDEEDVSLHLVDESATKTAISELQADADRLLMADSDYRRELGHWIGLGALGSSWLLARVGQAVVTHLDVGDREAAKNSALIDSAPVVVVLTTEADDAATRVRAGQAFERVALRASTADLAVHPMSQTLERPEFRNRLGELLRASQGVPQHLFRLGYADETPSHTPRWPLQTFLADE